MKTLEELSAIRDRMKNKVALRDESNETRIVVGMATCGIAAGARPVLAAFVEEVDKAGLNGKVSVTQTGCIGMCRLEPIVEVMRAGEEKITYVRMTADKAKEIMEKHIKGGSPVLEYTIGNA